MKKKRDWLSVPEAALHLNVSERTLRHWCKRQWIECEHTPSGRYRLMPAVVNALASSPLVLGVQSSSAAVSTL